MFLLVALECWNLATYKVLASLLKAIIPFKVASVHPNRNLFLKGVSTPQEGAYKPILGEIYDRAEEPLRVLLRPDLLKSVVLCSESERTTCKIFLCTNVGTRIVYKEHGAIAYFDFYGV